ncbi:hypothetical protein BDZ97DRAFT_1837185 [Flammula alnicola]|nr:hypothetical protein BDZ97DRAFT_1837185 [Flammula alnicola]
MPAFSRPTYTVPQDIIDCCIDELVKFEDPKESRTALRNCLQVSWSFADRCRSYLFKKVILSTRWREESLSQYLYKFLDIVESPDGIAPYIKTLELSLGGIKHAVCTSGMAVSRDDKHAAFASALEALQSRCKIEKIDCNVGALLTPRNNSVDWFDLGTTFRTALSNLICSPHCSKLSITGFHSVPVALLTGGNVKELQVDEIQFDRHSSGAVHLLAPGSRWLISSNLESVETDLRPYDDTIVWAFIDGARHSMKNITLNFHDTILTPTRPFQIGNFPLLESCNLNCSLFFIHLREEERSSVYNLCVGNIMRHLNTEQPLKGLCKIRVTISITLAILHTSFFEPFTDHSAWACVDPLLSSDKYPVLTDFSLCLKFTFFNFQEHQIDEPSFLSETRQSLNEAFHSLSALPSPTLSLDLSVTPIIVDERCSP